MDTLLSIQERIVSIVQTSDLIKDEILYLPKSGYQIRSGQIRNLKEDDQGYLKKYVGCMEGQMCYDENEFFIVETGVSRIKEGVVPQYLFVITFSPEAIINTMTPLKKEENGEYRAVQRVQENLAQKAQMKQLQAQINPHFLYNSFFVLSRRVGGFYGAAADFAANSGECH